MQAASLQILEQAEVPPAQARAIVQAIEIEIAGSKETLATKQDVLLLKQEVLLVKQDVLLLKQDVRHEISELRTDLRRIEDSCC